MRRRCRYLINFLYFKIIAQSLTLVQEHGWRVSNEQAAEYFTALRETAADVFIPTRFCLRLSLYCSTFDTCFPVTNFFKLL